MNHLVAIDPGVKACGVAVFDSGRLTLALHQEVTPATTFTRQNWCFFAGGHVVIEMPRIYPGSRQKGDQNDLMRLAVVVGRLYEAALAAGSTVELVEPRAWKGTLDGDAMVERIKGRLPIGESSQVFLPTAASLQHNVWDAIGIGLKKLGRLDPVKVFPR